MKKIFLATLFIIINLFAFSQNNDQDIKTLKSQIEKSDKDLTNPKKTQDANYWAKRAQIFIEAYKVNSKFLAPGLEAGSIPLLGITESTPAFYGKPINVEKNKDFEIWIYPKIKIYIDKHTQTIDHWEDLYVIDPQAIDKAYEAYTKVKELDAGNKVLNKKNIKQNVAELRDLLMNRSIQKYTDSLYKEALQDLEKSINLYNDFPRLENDTTTKIGAFYYYAGVFAYNAKDNQKSIYYFNKSIESQYEIGTSYQYIAQNYYEQNDSAKAEKILLEAADKYPKEEKIIYILIDFYTPKGEYEKAFVYLDKAIEMSPNNAQLYFVQGNAYEKVYYTLEAKYFKALQTAENFDKEAFKNRTDPQKSKEFEEKRDKVLNNDVVEAEKQMNDYSQKALNSYNKALSFNPNSLDFNYQIAYFNYTRAVNSKNTSSSLLKLKDISAKLEAKSTEYLNDARKYAEKSNQIDPNDIYTLRLLKNIYYRLQMNDKYNEIIEKIKQLQNK